MGGNSLSPSRNSQFSGISSICLKIKSQLWSVWWFLILIFFVFTFWPFVSPRNFLVTFLVWVWYFPPNLKIAELPCCWLFLFTEEGHVPFWFPEAGLVLGWKVHTWEVILKWILITVKEKDRKRNWWRAETSETGFVRVRWDWLGRGGQSGEQEARTGSTVPDGEAGFLKPVTAGTLLKRSGKIWTLKAVYTFLFEKLNF